MAGYLGQGDRVVVITGMLSLENHVRSARSFVEAYGAFHAENPGVEIVEAHEDEDESFRKCYELLSARQPPAGIYVNTVNSLPVYRAISVCRLTGLVRLITTAVFRDLIPFFDRGIVSASIHGRPFALGETAIRLIVDHLLNGEPLPATSRLTPHVVLRSNCRSFREARQEDPGSPELVVAAGVGGFSDPSLASAGDV